MATRKTKTTKARNGETGRAKPARSARAKVARPKSFSVGDSITINGDESKQIGTTQGQIDNLRIALAKLYEEHEMRVAKFDQTKAQILQSIAKARDEQVSAIRVAGEKHGIRLEEGKGHTWSFDTDAMKFTRTA